MHHFVLQLEDIRKSGKIEAKDAKVTKSSILSTRSKRTIGAKTKCLNK